MALWKRGRRYWTYFSVNGVQLRRPLCPQGSTLATTNWQEACRLEKEMIRRVLNGYKGNLADAARALGITRKGLYYKRQRFGML